MRTLKSQTHIKTPNSKSKRFPISKQKLAKIEEQSSLLAQNLTIIPFTPDPQTISSISTHEKLFRDLNLWDFANLKLDLEIKKDFLIEFIAYYDPSKRSSYVDGHRISFSRADLSKALSLPSKIHKLANLEFDATEFGGADKVSDILWKFIFNKIVFSEEVAILPDEVANATSLVKAGSPNKVDWAGLIMFLIEKEIMDAPCSGYFHYAAHLQCLMKFQKPRLFEEMESKELEPSKATVAEDDCVTEEVAGGSSVNKCGTLLSSSINVDSEMKKVEDKDDLGILQCDGKKEMDVDLNKKDDNMDKMVDDVHAEELGDGEKVEDTSKDNFVDSSKLTIGDIDMGKTVTDFMDCEKVDTSEDDFADSSKLTKGVIDIGKTVADVMDAEKVEDTAKDDFIDLCKLTKGDIDMGKTVTDVMDVEVGEYHKGKEVEGREEGDTMNFELGSLNRNDVDKGTIVNDVMDVGIVGPNEGSNGKTEVGEGKFPNFDRLNSSDFLQVMESNNNLLFNESIDHLNRDVFSIERSDMHDKSMNLELGQGGSFYFANEHKRCNEDTNHHVDEFQHKRFRSDQPWEQTPTITSLNQLSEELQHQMEKIKMDVAEKEREYTDITMQVQHVNKILQPKDEIIRTLENNRMEAMRKRQLEASRFDHDLKHLSNIFYGCKKALKDTENRFAEYRAKYPIGGKKCDNELDAEDSKQCLEKEKEVHLIARSMIADFSEVWLGKMYNLEKSLQKPIEKLVAFKEQVDAWKESVTKAKNPIID